MTQTRRIHASEILQGSDNSNKTHGNENNSKNNNITLNNVEEIVKADATQNEKGKFKT
ncbi:unnamed protein product [Meloidogyne enterolobii]|uniref:Uncharacterized protein n=1 Tax=Meloidogyne enterolobii TaxID=390850 RepID=A0ACB0ZTS7_MELEN